MKNLLLEFKEHLIEIRQELGKLDVEDIELCYEGCFGDKLSLPVEAGVSDDFGGEPLKLTGDDLNKFIELMEIIGDNKYLKLHKKLLDKKVEIAEKIISQNSR